MSITITKRYGDDTLLFKSDVDVMWEDLESKTNGNLDSTDVNADWATWGQVTLDKDASFYFGLTASLYVRYISADDQLVFTHVTTARDTLFKINGTELGSIDSSKNLSLKKLAYFYNRNTDYSLTRLVGNYCKPTLVYSDSTTINVEQNVEVDNETLIVFPVGPIAVTEDVTATHKFRQLKTSATANGYASGHTGAADSGMKAGLSLTANTWYFVYAVRVQYGDDAGNKFILVAYDTNPATSNWSTIDTLFGSGQWVYLGAFRYGYGGTATTTLIPFMYDHQGWCTFMGRAAANDFFGIRVDSSSVTSSTYATLETFDAANSGDAAPATMSALKVTIRAVTDADADMQGQISLGYSSTDIAWDLASFGNNLNAGEAHGMSAIIPNGKGLKVLAKRGNVSAEDYDVKVYISAVLDEFV